MPYILKPNKLYVKNPEGSGFLPQNIVTDQATEDMIAQVEAAGASTISEVQQAVSDSQNAVAGIDAQRDTIIASIASVAGQGTDTTLTQSGVAADAKAAGDTIGDLKSVVTYANDKISDLNGVIFIDVNSFEIGSAYVSDSALVYNNSTTRIRTKQGTYYHLKQGDVISMTSSGTYKYYWIYSANGTSWAISSTLLDSNAPVTVETTGYYMFVILGQSSITFDDATMKTAASKLKVERNGSIKAITDRITTDENDYAFRFTILDDITEHTSNKLSDVNGGVYIAPFELGSAYVTNSELLYNNSTIRIRTKQGVLNRCNQGDVISMTVSSGYKYCVYFSADGETWTAGSFKNATAETTFASAGYYAIIIGKSDDGTINASEVADIASKIKCTRTGIIETLAERISSNERAIKVNSDIISEHTNRLLALDGIVQIPTMECHKPDKNTSECYYPVAQGRYNIIFRLGNDCILWRL